MGQRGPARTPAEIAKQRGTYRPDRHGDGSYSPEIRVPDPPDWWKRNSPAAVEWERITAELFPVGLITEQDRAALVIYCEAWADYVEARSLLAADGPILEATTGYKYSNPANGLVERARKAMLDVSKRFGFTPSDRTGIKTNPVAKPKSAVAEWSALKGGGA